MKIPKKKPKEKTFYEREEERLQDQLFLCDAYQSDEEYDSVLDKLERVHKLAHEKKEPKVNGDTIAKNVTYLIGIGMVIGVELAGGLLRSSAMKFIPKP